MNLCFLIHMPIPSASSKIFWPSSKYFDQIQCFLNTLKCFWIDILPYKFAYLSMVKTIWSHSKNVEHNQSDQNHFWTSRWIRQYVVDTLLMQWKGDFSSNERASTRCYYNIFEKRLQDLFAFKLKRRDDSIPISSDTF